MNNEVVGLAGENSSWYAIHMHLTQLTADVA